MSWIRLDDALFQDDWYNELSDPTKLAWIHLLLFANRNRGTFRRSSPKLLSINLNLKENSVAEMLKSALENGKILQIDQKTYAVKSWRKYHPDPTSSERQRRFREKQSNGYVTGSNGNSRYVTDVTPTSTSTSTSTIPPYPPTREEERGKEEIHACPNCKINLVDNQWCRKCDYTTDNYLEKYPDPPKNSTENSKNQ